MVAIAARAQELEKDVAGGARPSRSGADKRTGLYGEEVRLLVTFCAMHSIGPAQAPNTQRAARFATLAPVRQFARGAPTPRNLWDAYERKTVPQGCFL